MRRYYWIPKTSREPHSYVWITTNHDLDVTLRGSGWKELKAWHFTESTKSYLQNPGLWKLTGKRPELIPVSLDALSVTNRAARPGTSSTSRPTDSAADRWTNGPHEPSQAS